MLTYDVGLLLNFHHTRGKLLTWDIADHTSTSYTMASLRRRIFGNSSAAVSQESVTSTASTTSADQSSNPSKEVRHIGTVKHVYHERKGRTRNNTLVFGLGGLFGLVLAGFFAQQQEFLNFDALLDMNLAGITDVIPAGILKDARDLTVCA